jgi:hypothetical protein
MKERYSKDYELGRLVRAGAESDGKQVYMR